MSKAVKGAGAVEDVLDPGEHHPNGNIHSRALYERTVFVCVFVCIDVIYPDLIHSDITPLSSLSQNC